MSATHRTATPSTSGHHRPALRKRLGQHHLRNPALCAPAVEFLRPTGRSTIEIGSGGGVLTAALAGAGAKVVAMDVDLAWSLEARRRLKQSSGRPVSWLAADAVEFGWTAVGGDWLVSGNLPYNVATPIVRRVLEQSAAPRMCFLVQKEVAERMTAGPGSRQYGLLSLVVGWWAEARLLEVVKPGSFDPPPKVDGQFVGLGRRSDAGEVEEYARVMAVAELAFTHRRKTLPNALRSRFDRGSVAGWCVEAGLPPSVRPERLSLEQYRSLSGALLPADVSASGRLLK